jgi:hypothetical protein
MLCRLRPCCGDCRHSRLFRAADIVGRVHGAERANLALRRSAALNLTADSTTNLWLGMENSHDASDNSCIRDRPVGCRDHLAAITITIRRHFVRNCRYAFPAGTPCCGRRIQAAGSGNRRSIIDLYCTGKTVSVTDRGLPLAAEASSRWRFALPRT